MSIYTPITAQEVADILGLWNSGDADDLPAEELAANMLSGEEPFEPREVAKIAEYYGLTVEGLALKDGRFERHLDAGTQARWEIARKLKDGRIDAELGPEICGLTEETFMML